MPRGLNHNGDFRNGNPVPATDPKFDSNPVTWTPDPKHFGNAVTWPTPNPEEFGNAVTWPPSPAHFGNIIALLTPATTPTFSPVAGSYAVTQSVTIASAGADNIYYTTDGSIPTIASTLYVGPVSVTATETLKALAVQSGHSNSTVGSAAYNISTVSDNFVRADGALGGSWGTVVNNTAETMYDSLTGGILISGDGYGPIAAGGGDAASLWQGTTFANDQWASAVVKTTAPFTAVLAITAASQNGGNTTYTYTVSSGSVAAALSTNTLYVIISGMAHAGNNGYFTATTFGNGTFTVANASGVTATESGTGNCPSDSGAGVVVRGSGTTAATLNGYFFHVGTNSYGGGGRDAYYELWKVVNGVGTILRQSNDGYSTSNRLPVPGDVISLSVVGTTLTAYLNGIVCTGPASFQITDNSIASGVPGIWAWSVSGPQEYVWANWNTVVNPPGNNGTTLNGFRASDLGSPNFPPTTQLAADTFTYTNGDLHTNNANWVYESASTFTVSSDTVFDSHAGLNAAYRSDVTPNADQYSQTTAVINATAATQNCGPAVRVSAGSQTFYCIQYATNVFSISKCVAGVFTVLASASSYAVTGDVVMLIVKGNTLYAVRNGVFVISVVDNDIATGNVGIFGAGNTTQNGSSAWAGGNVVE